MSANKHEGIRGNTQKGVEVMTTSSRSDARPLSEGANIESWIGFKHFSYLAEGAVQYFLRDTGMSQDDMLRETGESVDMVEFSLRLPSPLYADSLVSLHVEGERANPLRPPTDALRVCGDRVSAEASVRCLEGRARLRGWSREELDATLSRTAQAGPAVSSTASIMRDAAPGLHDWLFTVPYPYCRASSVMQFDGYVRLVEDSVERFLRAQGVSVRRLLVERGWIPVVTRWSLTIDEPVLMEEELVIGTDVTGVFKGLLWDSNIGFHVVRDGERVTAARASITHGYAITRGRLSGKMAAFDDELLHAFGQSGK